MHESVMQRMWNSAHLSGGNAAYVEELYELYLHDLTLCQKSGARISRSFPPMAILPRRLALHSARSFRPAGQNQRRAQPVSAGSVSSEHEKKQVEVLRLIHAYRLRGHQASTLDPLGLWQRPAPADLSIDHYGLTGADLDTTFRTGELYIGKEEATLREIVDSLKSTYCGTFGAEFMHIVDSEQRKWFLQRLESVRGRPGFSAEARAHLLERLTAAEGLRSTWAPSTRAPSVSAWKAAKA